MNDFWLIYSTFPTSEEAFFVARTLLEARLVACANVSTPVTSMYRWEGNIQRATEVVMVSKTHRNVVDDAISCIKGLHSYEIPCIVALPISNGLEPFLEWIHKETQHSSE